MECKTQRNNTVQKDESQDDAGQPDAGQFQSLAPYYDELMSLVPYAQWVEYVQLLWSLHDFAPQSVLDAACGTGNVSFELAQRGYRVMGVDLSAEMIEIAHQKAVASALPGSVEFAVADLTQLALARTFDAATCLYDSLNYLLDPHDLKLCFASMRQHVRSGGLWVFDLNSDWAFRANLFTQTQRNPRQELHYQWNADFDPQSRICRVDMRFEKRGRGGQNEIFHETHRERAYLLDEIVELLQQTGWNLLGSYDAYTLNRPHARSERWYFVVQNS